MARGFMSSLRIHTCIANSTTERSLSDLVQLNSPKQQTRFYQTELNQRLSIIMVCVVLMVSTIDVSARFHSFYLSQSSEFYFGLEMVSQSASSKIVLFERARQTKSRAR